MFDIVELFLAVRLHTDQVLIKVGSPLCRLILTEDARCHCSRVFLTYTRTTNHAYTVSRGQRSVLGRDEEQHGSAWALGETAAWAWASDVCAYSHVRSRLCAWVRISVQACAHGWTNMRRTRHIYHNTTKILW